MLARRDAYAARPEPAGVGGRFGNGPRGNARARRTDHVAVVPLADIAKDPAQFQGRVFATTGKITAVCQEMGCWMQIEDAVAAARTCGCTGTRSSSRGRRPGHSPASKARWSSRRAAPTTAKRARRPAKLELDATGVEIDD